MEGPPFPEGEPRPPKAALAKPLTDLDFRSGARIEELNQLIQEFEARNAVSVRDAPELHRAKDRVFSLLGLAQKSNPRLPPVNRYLLLSGGVQQGSVHLGPGHLPPLSPGTDYDATFTLLVPVLNAAGVPATLDMTQSPPGHTRLSLRPFGPTVLGLWSDLEDEEAYLAADQVAEWFFQTLAACAGDDTRVERSGVGITSAIVRSGALRILFDVLPVVAFRGWPEVAQAWLAQAHFWDGKLNDEEAAGGFYLLPSSGADWRLGFSASELSLRRILPLPLAWALRAAAAIFEGGHLGSGVRPYHLFTLALWSCERLPSSFLSREENTAHAMLGLLDDLVAALVHRRLPSYFLPEWNLLEGLSRLALERLACEAAQVRAEPAKHLRRVVERAKEARRVVKALREQAPAPATDGLTD